MLALIALRVLIGYFGYQMQVQHDEMQFVPRKLDSNTTKGNQSLLGSKKQPILASSPPSQSQPSPMKSTKSRVITVGPAINDFTTVFSIYFVLLKKSKRPLEKYDLWIRAMLPSVRAPLAMFIDSLSYEKYKHVRPANESYRTTYYVYDSVWSLLGELERHRNMSYADNYRHNQSALEVENYHSPDMYAIWNLKPYLMKRVTELNPYASTFFLYTDAGAWREGSIPDWPGDAMTRQVARRLEANRTSKILIGHVGLKNDEYFPFHDVIQAGFLAGSRAAVRDYERVYYALHDEIIS